MKGLFYINDHLALLVNHSRIISSVQQRFQKQLELNTGCLFDHHSQLASITVYFSYPMGMLDFRVLIRALQLYLTTLRCASLLQLTCCHVWVSIDPLSLSSHIAHGVAANSVIPISRHSTLHPTSDHEDHGLYCFKRSLQYEAGGS